MTIPATVVFPVAQGADKERLGRTAHRTITDGAVIPKLFGVLHIVLGFHFFHLCQIFVVCHDVILTQLYILSSGALLLGSIRAGLGPLLSGFYPTTKIVYHEFIESQAGLGIFGKSFYVSNEIIIKAVILIINDFHLQNLVSFPLWIIFQDTLSRLLVNKRLG